MKQDKISVKERQAKALELRALGKTYREIAKELGYSSHSAVYGLIERAFDGDIKEGVDKVRLLELQRLDMMLEKNLLNAIAGDVKAVNAVIQIMGHRAKLLGLASPTQIEEELRVQYINNWRGKPEDLAAIEEMQQQDLEE